MVSAKGFLQIGGLVTLVLGIALYHPVHEDLHDRTKMRISYAIDNFMKYVGDFEEWRGNNRWFFVRAAFEKLASRNKQPLEEGIQERKEVFEDVNVHIFEPIDTSAKPRPALIYIHGGGFTFGSTETHRNLGDVFAKRLQIVVISVNFRLTPEIHYPAQLDDVLAVVNYVHKNAKKLGIDKNNIGVGGDSAGGNLAAATALKLRDTSSAVKLKYQVLIYPYVQGLTVDLPSYQDHAWHTYHFLSKKSVAEFTTMYVGADIKLAEYVKDGRHTTPEIWKKYGHLVDPKLLPPEYVPSDFDIEAFAANRLEDKDHGISQESMDILINPYAYPLMADSLVNLPPAFVLTCHLDPIRDEGVLYAQRLQQDGVSVTHYEDKHGYHGMMLHCKGPAALKSAKDAIDAIVKFIDKMRAS